MIKQGLKTFKKPALLLSASLGLWLGVSCQDDMLAERQPVITAGDEISFAVASDSAIAARSLASAPPVTHRQFLTTIGKDSLFLYTTIEENTDQPFKQSAESRAAQKTDETLKSNSFYVDAMYRSEVNPDAQFMNGTQVEWKDGAWKYSPVKYWPNNEGDYLDFYGYMDAPKTGTFAWNTKHEEFSYQLPAPRVESDDALGQTDLIFAQALNQTKQSINGRVVLNFYHALSAVLFKVGSLPSDISLTNLKITLNDVKNSGTCTITNTNNVLSFSWDTENEGTQNYSQIFSSSDGKYVNGESLSTIDDKTAFMMIPQTFDGASMNIYFKINDVEYNFNHPLVIGEGEEAHTGWNANTKYTYILTIHEYVEVDVEDRVSGTNNTLKDKVTIQNTGLANAYIRAAIIGYWVNENNQVVAPWYMTDDAKTEENEMEGTFAGLPGTNWVKGSDGFFYYQNVVPPGGFTDALFTSYKLTSNPPIVGSSLKLNIVVQAVKSTEANRAGVWQDAIFSIDENGILMPNTK